MSRLETKNLIPDATRHHANQVSVSANLPTAKRCLTGVSTLYAVRRYQLPMSIVALFTHLAQIARLLS
jgi:hypothetical protein